MSAVRPARAGDLPAIATVYAAAAEAGPATFDLEGPSLGWWEAVLADAAPGHLLLVAADAGAVLGFAKSGTFRPKAAYATTVETSVYVADGRRGRGLGDALYTALLARLEASSARLAVAGVTVPNPASERLHERHGFAVVGTFTGVGVKFGRPWDVRWYERPLTPA